MRNRSGLVPELGGTNQGTPGVVVGHVDKWLGLLGLKSVKQLWVVPLDFESMFHHTMQVILTFLDPSP